MTPTEHRPGDAARRALRAARERAEVERSERAPARVPLGETDAPGTGRGVAGAAPRGETDVPRAGRAGAGAPLGDAAERETDEATAGPARGEASTSGAEAQAVEATGASADDTAHDSRPTPTVAPSPAAAARPGDVAREALRAARREARLAEAAQPRARRGPRTPGRPDTSPRAGEETGGSRAQAARDMRQFLATAFRMPTWVDAPEETGDSDAHGGIDAPGDSDAPGGSGHLSESGAAASAPESGPEGGPSAGSSAGPAAGTARAGDGTESGRPAREPGPRHRAEPPATSPRALDDAESGARESVRGREDVTGPAAVSPRGDDDGVESGLPEHPGEERRRDVPSESGHGPDGSWTPPPRALEGIDPRLWGRRMEPEVREVPGVPGVPEASEDADGGASAAPFLPSPSAPAAPAQVPATMATPHRDGELRRTFPAFAPRPAAPDGGAFAETWWGNAWTDALERQALDARRLERGRGYADLGKVDAITVTPGLVLAYVRGSRPRPYRVQMRLRTLEDADWERFLDAAADRPGHIAALLDKELPQSLADCGVPLLPGPGDLVPRCSCPDSGHPCKHAAALCYQTARLLDADPFVLLLLRGRGERELLDALSRRSAARAARATRERAPQALPGIRASTALDASRRLAPLPAPLPVPPHPEQPPVYPAVPGGPDPFALDQLATDAAARAHTLLAAGIDPVAELTLWQDAVRLAAARPGSGLTAATRALYATLAAATDRTPADLARAVAAWRQGGLAGLAVLEEPWDPPAGRFDRARPLLLAADLPSFRPWRNRLTHPLGHAQLRLGRDGLWYAYESEPGQDDWWPRGTPDLDPVGALTGLGAAGDL